MKLKYVIPAALLGASLLVWAAIRGPFHVASVGAKWAQYTFSLDSNNEFEAAEEVFNKYVESVVISAGERRDAVKNDYIRVVYYDGQIADFKIMSFGNTLDLRFDRLLPFKEAPSKPSRRFKSEKQVSNRVKGCYDTKVTYETGYWGDRQESRDNPEGGLPVIAVISAWISTGFVTVMEYDNCK